MKSFFITVSRYALAAWIGAAVLFVMTAVAEVRSPDLDSAAKSTLALLRFPYYYAVGFTLVGVGTCCEFLAGSTRRVRNRRIIVSLLTLTLVLMSIDYFLIYQPLAEMTRQQSRPANFIAYHHYSRWMNTAHVLIALLASIFMCSSSRQTKP